MNPFNENEQICQIISNVNTMLYSKHLDGHFIYISEQCESFTGYTSEELVKNPTLWIEKIHRDDLPLYREKWKALQEDGACETEYRFIAKEGTVKWFKETIVAVKDEKGMLIRADGTVRNISFRRAIEDEVLLIRSAINSAQNGIIIVDAKHPRKPIIFANDGFVELTGYTQEEVIGKNCRFLQGQDRDQEGLQGIREAIAASDKANTILRNYKKNGDLFYNHIYISPVKNKDNEVTHYIGVQYDVTEKIELQKELKDYYEKEKYLRYMMAAIADLNKIIGTAKKPSELYQKMCQKLIEIHSYQYVWLGIMKNNSIDVEYALGKDTMEPAQEKKYLANNHKKMVERGKANEMIRGQHRELGHWMMMPILNQGQTNNPLGYLLIYTHRKDGFLDEEISTLQDVTSSISNAIEYQKNDQLMFYQARQAAMGELIGHLAHQWRQPINELGLILQDLRDAFLNNELDENYIVQSTRDGMDLLQKMSGTIDDFRTYFTESQQKESFRVAEVIQQGVNLVKSNFLKFSIDIKIIEEMPVIMVGYTREFAQVVLHLLNNSKDAIRRQKIEKPWILIKVWKSQRKAFITLEDNGGGVPEGAIDHIFDQYYSSKDELSGAGLGLYISKMIVENNMNGSVVVENTVNGVKFTLEVPIDE